MSTRPALTLVKEPTPRPGRRALEFIRWAVDTFGEAPTNAGDVVVPRSQTALVAAHATIDSHGTVSWYMRHLRDAGVVVSVRPITVDMNVLGQFTGEPGAPSNPPADEATAGPLAGATSRSVSPLVVELLVQRAEQHARLAQLQAELAITDAAIARSLVDVHTTRDPLAGTREVATWGLAKAAEIREFRESGLAIQEGRKVDLDNPPSFLAPTFANRDRESRESSRTADAAPAEPPLSFEQVDEIVEPIRAMCRASGRPHRLDDNGRETLARLGRTLLTVGAQRFCEEASKDLSIHKPMGMFVHRADRLDPNTFLASSRLAALRHDGDCPCDGRGLLPTDSTLTNYIPCPGSER